MTLTWKGILKTLSPMTHNSDESMGTDTKFRRISVLYNGKSVRVPHYSGNAFRGILRRIGAKQLFDALGLEKISDALYYMFFCGGALKKGSQQNYIDIGAKRELRANIPFLSIFGAAVQNTIMPGKMEIGLAMPIAKETQELTGIQSDVSVWSMIDDIFYTRRDDLEDREEERKKDDGAQQMKYNIEVLTPGVELQHNISLFHCNEIEQACFGYAMSALIEKGILGGKSGTGHGRVQFNYSPEFPNAKPYLDFLKKEKDAVVQYIRDMEGKL